jgi:hypothetical protein
MNKLGISKDGAIYIEFTEQELLTLELTLSIVVNDPYFIDHLKLFPTLISAAKPELEKAKINLYKIIKAIKAINYDIGERTGVNAIKLMK